MTGINDVCNIAPGVGAAETCSMPMNGPDRVPLENFQGLPVLDGSLNREHPSWGNIEGPPESFGGALKSLGEKISLDDGAAASAGPSKSEAPVIGDVPSRGSSNRVSDEAAGSDVSRVTEKVPEDPAKEKPLGGVKAEPKIETAKTEEPHHAKGVEIRKSADEKSFDVDIGTPAAAEIPVPAAVPVKNIESVVAAVRIPPAPSASQIAVAAAQAVAETMSVSAALSVKGEGEIHIQLKNDVLDGSFVRLETKDGELKITVTPASRTAEGIFMKNQEIFELQLAQRVANWRINVGVSAWSARSAGGRSLEDRS